jgi:hypothetical protein
LRVSIILVRKRKQRLDIFGIPNKRGSVLHPSSFLMSRYIISDGSGHLTTHTLKRSLRIRNSTQQTLKEVYYVTRKIQYGKH